jgi:hypothetical protein
MNKPFFFIFYFKIKLQKINGLRLLRNFMLVMGLKVLALEEIKVYNGIEFFPEQGALGKHLKFIFVGFLLSNNYVLVKLKKISISYYIRLCEKDYENDPFYQKLKRITQNKMKKIDIYSFNKIQKDRTKNQDIKDDRREYSEINNFNAMRNYFSDDISGININQFYSSFQEKENKEYIRYQY